MRPLRYSINVTLDGCCDHQAISGDETLHRHQAANLARADALLFGRVTYQMMEEAWREPARTGVMPEWMQPWMMPFARTIDAAKKYVVSSALEQVDWNAELVRGDLGEAVEQLKARLPHVRTSGGISNVSFSFRGNNPVREAIHAVFLFHAIRAGATSRLR